MTAWQPQFSRVTHAILARQACDEEHLLRPPTRWLSRCDVNYRVIDDLHGGCRLSATRPQKSMDGLTAFRTALNDRYIVDREIGRGGMAVVYRAHDVKHDRAVAIKVLRPDLDVAPGVDRFLREVKLTARLQHPHILPLYDSGGAPGGVLYYVTPLVEGESLRDRLRRDHRLPIADATRIAREVADALAYAHSKGTIHRDIKPANILLSDGHAIVADFGIARALRAAGGDSLTDTGAALGTPAYMSPEQILGEREIDGRTDIYSLGCVLFEMLTGRVPFVGEDGQVIIARRFTSPPPSVRELRPTVRGELEDVVTKAMASEPAARFQNPRDLVTALEALPSLEAAGTMALMSSSVTSERAQAAVPANLGSFVSRTCNRWRQINAFDASLRAARQSFPGKAQFYVIHGDEGGAHESLVERLMATRIRHFANEIAGEDRGTVANFRIPWPDDDDLDTACRDLTISLFREVAPEYLGDDLSSRALATLSAGSLTSVVVIQHTLRPIHWRPNTEALIRWYATTFWNDATSVFRAPVFMIFMNVIYPVTGRRFSVANLFRPRMPDKRTLHDRLRRLFDTPALGCPATVLGELGSVSVEDVEGWFSQNGIYQSEQRRRELAASLFQTSRIKPLAEVELALERIHRDFVRQVARTTAVRA